MIRLLAIAVLVCGFRPLSAAESLAEARQPVDAAWQQSLQGCIEKWTGQSDGEEAKQTRLWLISQLDRRLVLFPLSRPVEPRGSRPKIDPAWEQEFTVLRQKQAASLFPLAEKFVQAEPAAVYRLLHEIVQLDPEHQQARAALDHRTQANKRWLTDLGPLPEVRPATTNHPVFGWRAGRYWRVESEHFQIVTSHSAAEGIYLAQELERFANIWRQLAFGIVSRPGALAARLAGGKEPLFKPRKHRVVLFRDREEYLAILGPRQPKIGLTTGIYYDQDQTSYFYAAGPGKRVADEPALRTSWLHEVTHQLFQEHLGGNAGEQGHFWLVEGIATYLESLTYYSNHATLGGWQADRLQFTRYRLLSGDRTWPLGKMLPLTKTEWQESPEIRRLYTQAAGMTSLLLDSEHGRLREPTLALLAAIYAGNAKTEQLTKGTGRSLEELDAALLAYLQLTDDDLQKFPPHPAARNLALGMTQVTDASLAKIAVCRDLEWLDLTRLPISDDGLQVLDSLPKLKQLFLERTKTTAASLPRIGKLRELEELDLTGWKISDDDLQPLAGLGKLKVLHLTDTPITDRGLVHLKGLKQLETIETAGTQVTPAGLKQLLLKKSGR